MKTKRSVNYVAVLILLVGTALLGVGVHFLHAYQVKRNARDLLAQADLAEQNGETKQVADYLGQYLGMVPTDTDVLARYGLLLEKHANSRGQLQRAFIILDKVVRLDGTRQDVRRQLVRIAVALGQFSDARYHLAALQKEAVDDAELLRLQARCEVGEAQYWKARDYYKQALEKDPSGVDLRLEYARLLRGKLQQQAEADDVMGQLLEEAPRSVPAHLAVARYYRQFASPENGLLDKAHKAIGAALNELKAQDADAFLLAAEIDEARKKPAEARSNLEQGLKYHPDDLPLRQALARVEIQAGQPEKALLELEPTLKTLPTKPEDLWTLGNLLLDLGQNAKLEEVIQRLDAGGHKGAGDCLRGRLSMRQGEWGKAHGLLARAKASQPLTQAMAAQVELLLSVCYERLGNPDQQLLAARRSLEGNPTLAAAWRLVASALVTLGKTDEAIQVYRLLVEQTPEDDADLARLLVARNASLPSASRQWGELEKILKRMPTTMAAKVLQAQVLVGQGKAEGARALMDAERTRDPKQVEPWLFLVALAEKEDQGKAVLPLLDEAERQAGRRVEWTLARAYHWVAVLEKAQPELTKLEADLPFFEGANRDQLLQGLGQAFLIVGDAKSCTRLWNELAKSQPTNLDVRLHLMQLAYRDDQGNELARLVEEVRRLEGGGALTSYGEASLLVLRARAGDGAGLAEARRKLGEIGKWRPSWAAVPLLEAEAFEVERRTDKALEKYQAALERGETRLGVVRRVLELLAGQGRFADAQALLSKMPERVQVVSGFDRVSIQLALVNPEGAGANEAAIRRTALDAARKKVAADSTDYRDYLWLGNMCLLAGERAGAEKAFRRARDLADTRPETWAALILTLAQTAPEKAESEMGAAKGKLTRQDLPGVLASGYEALGRPEQAEAEFKNAIAARPEDPVALRAAASFYARSGQPDKAEPYLRKAIDPRTKAPEDVAGWARRTLAFGLALRGNLEQFREAEELVKEHPGETVEDAAARALVKATRAEHRQQAIQLFESLSTVRTAAAPEMKFLLAQLYEANGDWSKAKLNLQALLAEAGKNPTYVAYCVRAALRHKEVDEAESGVQRLAELDGPALVKLELRARVLHAQGKPEEAVKLLNAYAQEKDARLDVAAALLDALGQPEQAEKLYRVLAGKAGQPNGVLLLAGHLMRRGRVPEALAICERAWQTCPPEQVAAISVLTLRSGRGSPEQYQQVERWLTAARQKKPESWLYTEFLAELEDGRGRYDKALELYRETIRQDPRNVVALNNAAFILAFTGTGGEALEMIDRAIGVAGQVGELLDTRAVVQLRQGHAALAVADMQQATTQKQSSSFYFHLAQAQVEAKNLVAGRRAWDKAMELGLTLRDLHPLEEPAFVRVKDELNVD